MKTSSIFVVFALVGCAAIASPSPQMLIQPPKSPLDLQHLAVADQAIMMADQAKVIQKHQQEDAANLEKAKQQQAAMVATQNRMIQNAGAPQQQQQQQQQLMKLQSVGKLLGLIGALSFAAPSEAFYLPGLAPHNYKTGDTIALNVNSLTPSMNAQQKLESVMSYDFYDSRFHFCVPEGGPQSVHESLGSILFGNRIFSSRFDIAMKRDDTCRLLCSNTIPKEDASFVADRISEGYNYNWLFDGLPAAQLRRDSRTDEDFYSMGFGLGSVISHGEQKAIHNHYDFEIQYHTVDERRYRVVGVLVTPSSRKTVLGADSKVDCGSNEPMIISEQGDNNVVYTYSVKWSPSDKSWATRWDNYLHVLDPKIHWFSLINSIVIVIFLTGMVALILMRTLRKDISRYNSEDVEDLQEDLGWKLVHGDVFREPSRKQLLSVLVGSGYQLFFMALSTMIFALLGFLSPSNRGSLATAMLVLQMLFGFAGGYKSSHTYHTLKGKNMKYNVIITCLFVPGVVISVLIFLNMFLIANGSSSAVPVGAFFGVIALWFIISIPLTLLGAYFGYRKKPIEHPTRTNQIPRQIPNKPWYLHPLPSALMGGILAFGSIFIELYFIMTSIWFHKLYYVFGFLFLVFIILVITCAEVSILMTYFHLSVEDYNWWWHSFFTSGASAFYVLLYSIFFYFTRLHLVNFTSAVLYFGWSFVISFLFFVLTGTIGFTASYWFVRKIYKSIKID